MREARTEGMALLVLPAALRAEGVASLVRSAALARRVAPGPLLGYLVPYLSPDAARMEGKTSLSGIPVVFLGSVRPGGPAPTEGPVRGEVEVVT